MDAALPSFKVSRSESHRFKRYAGELPRFSWSTEYSDSARTKVQCRTFNWYGHTTPDRLVPWRQRLHPTEEKLLRLLEHRAQRAFHCDVKFSIEKLAELMGISRQHVTRCYKRLAQMGFIGVCRRVFRNNALGAAVFSTAIMFRVHSIGYSFQWDFREHSTKPRFKQDIRPKIDQPTRDRRKMITFQDKVRIDTRALGRPISEDWFVLTPERRQDHNGTSYILQPRLGNMPQFTALRERFVSSEFLAEHDILKTAYESNHAAAMAVFGKPIVHEDAQDYDYDSRR